MISGEIDLEQCSNVYTLTFFKLCRDCQSLHAMSQQPACSSCEWGGNCLFTPRKSLTLLSWLQHCLAGFHITFLPLGSCPAEWGVGLGHQYLFNSLAGYTLCLSSNAQALKSIIFAAKVCDWVLKSVIVYAIFCHNHCFVHLLSIRCQCL